VLAVDASAMLKRVAIRAFVIGCGTWVGFVLTRLIGAGWTHGRAFLGAMARESLFQARHPIRCLGRSEYQPSSIHWRADVPPRLKGAPAC